MSFLPLHCASNGQLITGNKSAGLLPERRAVCTVPSPRYTSSARAPLTLRHDCAQNRVDVARIATFADTEAFQPIDNIDIQPRGDQLLGRPAAKLLFSQFGYIAEVDFRFRLLCQLRQHAA